jgi:hypothetical protein
MPGAYPPVRGTTPRFPCAPSGNIVLRQRTDARSTVLLDADPDLGRLLDDERLAEARRQLVVRQHTVEPGP